MGNTVLESTRLGSTLKRIRYSVSGTYICDCTLPRVANSHAYGVILTHLTCYSRTHAIDQFTHAFKRNHTHTHAIL